MLLLRRCAAVDSVCCLFLLRLLAPAVVLFSCCCVLVVVSLTIYLTLFPNSLLPHALIYSTNTVTADEKGEETPQGYVFYEEMYYLCVFGCEYYAVS